MEVIPILSICKTIFVKETSLNANNSGLIKIANEDTNEMERKTRATIHNDFF